MKTKWLLALFVVGITSAGPVAAYADVLPDIGQVYESLQGSLKASREAALLKKQAEIRHRLAEEQDKETHFLRLSQARELIKLRVEASGISERLRTEAGMDVHENVALDGRVMTIESAYGITRHDTAGFCKKIVNARITLTIRADEAMSTTVAIEQEGQNAHSAFASLKELMDGGQVSQLRDINSRFISTFGAIDTSCSFKEIYMPRSFRLF
jgi:hypothetical protein